MPYKPPTCCKHGRCNKLVPSGERYCSEHKPLHVGERDSASKRGYNSRWQKARAAYLKAHPLCVLCMEKNPPEYRKATVVDHIKAHRMDPKLFWDKSNWRALCKSCHDKKTAREDRVPEYHFQFTIPPRQCFCAGVGAGTISTSGFPKDRCPLKHAFSRNQKGGIHCLHLFYH